MGMEQNTGQPASEQDQFDEAFAQLAKSNESPDKPATAGAASEAADAPKQAQAAAAQPNTQNADDGVMGRAGAASTDKPGSAPAAASKPGSRTVEELEQLLGEALHKERSNANRISTNDRRANELAAENAELKKQLAALKTSQKPAATGGKTIDDVLSNAPELQDAVNRRIEEALASATKPMQDALDAANAKLAEVGETAVKAVNAVEPMVQRDAEKAITSVMGQLDDAFTPGWRKEVSGLDFKLWLRKQGRGVQSVYEDSTSFEDSASVLDLYYQTKGGRPQSATPAANGATPNANTNAQPAASRQQDRLRDAAGIAPRQAARVSDKKDDYEGSFEEASALLRASKRNQQ